MNYKNNNKTLQIHIPFKSSGSVRFLLDLTIF